MNRPWWLKIPPKLVKRVSLVANSLQSPTPVSPLNPSNPSSLVPLLPPPPPQKTINLPVADTLTDTAAAWATSELPAKLDNWIIFGFQSVRAQECSSPTGPRLAAGAINSVALWCDLMRCTTLCRVSLLPRASKEPQKCSTFLQAHSRLLHFM